MSAVLPAAAFGSSPTHSRYRRRVSFFFFKRICRTLPPFRCQHDQFSSLNRTKPPTSPNQWLPGIRFRSRCRVRRRRPSASSQLDEKIAGRNRLDITITLTGLKELECYVFSFSFSWSHAVGQRFAREPQRSRWESSALSEEYFPHMLHFFLEQVRVS